MLASLCSSLLLSLLQNCSFNSPNPAVKNRVTEELFLLLFLLLILLSVLLLLLVLLLVVVVVAVVVDAFNLNATYFEAANVPVIGAIFNKLSLNGFYSLENI